MKIQFCALKKICTLLKKVELKKIFLMLVKGLHRKQIRFDLAGPL